MEINDIAIKIIILLIPGGITTVIIESLTIHKKWSEFKFVIYTILLGTFSYLSIQFVELLFELFKYIFISEKCKYEPRALKIWESINQNVGIPLNEILLACIMGIINGFVISAIIYYKIVFRIAKKLKVSSKYGEENLFSYLLNSNDVVEIYVRDIPNNLTYHGKIDSFSENDNSKEILLYNVKVYEYQTSTLLSASLMNHNNK